MTTEPKTLFLTGVTGTLGKKMVQTLLEQTDHKLYLLIRRKQRYSHWDRARKILAGFGQEVLLGTRVHVFEGDVTLPDMGMRPEELNILAREVDEFYHIAALTALNGSEEECTRINIGGAQQAINLAWGLRKKGKLQRLFYYSTAYVAGSLQKYCSFEDTLPEHPAHANYYESSKYQAEKKIRAAIMEGLPVTIFRPSIVVGDSRTGEVSEFNVIYPFMKLYVHGLLSVLPTRLENSFNIVPIDFVIRASLAIAAREDSIGKTFHLVTQNPPQISLLLKVREEYPSIPDIEVIQPESFNKDSLNEFSQTTYQMLEPYLGYLNGELTFDTTNTEKFLEGTGLSFPNTDFDFLKLLFRYAVDAGYLVV